MSILDNEGHDPLGLGNVPRGWASVLEESERRQAEIGRLKVVLQTAKELSRAMIDAEMDGENFDAVDEKWAALTAAIVSYDGQSGDGEQK